MKKIAVIAATVCLGLFGLTGCNAGIKETTVDTYWTMAEKAESLEEYVKTCNENYMNKEALKTEALDSESTFSEKFKATAILCMMEYQAGLEDNSIIDSMPDEMFHFDYSESRDLANECLTMVVTDEEVFWTTLEETFYPYDCLLPMFAAADSLDGQILDAFLKDVPESASYKDKLEEAVDKWVKKHPEKLPEIKDSLMDAGYYEDWEALDWKDVYFYDLPDSHKMTDGTVEEAINEALTYMDYQRTSLLPELMEEFGSEEFYVSSSGDESGCYNTGLDITIREELNLIESSESENEAKIPETAGKKVIAFYRNLQKDEFEGSPASLRILGDFMLTLPEEEFPKTAAEADYYLVLTPSYEYGGYYTYQSGGDSEIREVYSSTSIDLYDAGTGDFLYHIGNIMENAPQTVFTNTYDKSAIYPSSSEDILLYIYHNLQKPERYTTLLDHTSGLDSPLEIGKTILIGDWEITYHSGEVVKEFISGYFKFTANDGCQFVRGQFTVTNKGDEENTLLPSFNYNETQLIIAATDSGYEEFYYTVDAWNDDTCLNSTTLDAGESKKGTLIFEVPDEVVEEGPLYITIQLGNQVVYYPVE